MAEGGEVIQVTKYFYYPYLLAQAFKHDVALLQLEKTIEFDLTKAPIALPSLESDENIQNGIFGDHIKYVSLGLTESYEFDEWLRAVSPVYIDRETCANIYWPYLKIFDEMSCANCPDDKYCSG